MVAHLYILIYHEASISPLWALFKLHLQGQIVAASNAPVYTRRSLLVSEDPQAHSDRRGCIRCASRRWRLLAYTGKDRPHGGNAGFNSWELHQKASLQITSQQRIKLPFWKVFLLLKIWSVMHIFTYKLLTRNLLTNNLVQQSTLEVSVIQEVKNITGWKVVFPKTSCIYHAF